MENTLLSILVFIVFLSWMLSLIANSVFLFMNPIVLGTIGIAIAAAFALGSTPLARSAAVGAVAGAVSVQFFLDFTALALPLEIVGVLITPIVIVMFYIFMELAKG
jgi:hypothetical protein